jgi:hypothetical protein
VEQIASTSDSLSNEAKDLSSIVGKFKVSGLDLGTSAAKKTKPLARAASPYSRVIQPEPAQQAPVQQAPSQPKERPAPQTDSFEDFEEF